MQGVIHHIKKNSKTNFVSFGGMKCERRRLFPSFLLLLSGLIMIICSAKNQSEHTEADSSKLATYPIQPVDIRNVKLTDNFWLPVIEKVQKKTLAYALDKSNEEGRFENFLIAGGKMQGEVRGAMPFDDSDVYKIIEGASNSLISAPNPQLENLLDSLIAIVAIGQEEDGYLTTWRTINPAKPPAEWVKVVEGKRWESLFMSHELYNAGHMYEAAAVHFAATGKKNFLDIALKNADLIVKVFGDGGMEAVPGHQVIETGLIKLYQITCKEEYLKLAKSFLDRRGVESGRELFGPYAQDHQPVTAQNEVVGHAVRAVYMYAGMTDIAVMYQDSAYIQAVNQLWDNMVHKKMYLTGGLGARHDGEAFGENYELPNKTAYSETCAAIGSVYWNHRLFRMTGNSEYYDVIERTMYNGLLSGLSLDGTNFFYPNALESDGVYKFNRGECTRQSWFDCSCCPTNLIRFLPSVPGLIYAQSNDTLFVNLYASNQAEIAMGKSEVKLTQQTDYPLSGNISIKVSPDKTSRFVIKLRIPGWARNQVLPGNLYSYQETQGQPFKVIVNGNKLNAKLTQGYVSIGREWKAGDEVNLSLAMSVRKVKSHPKVTENLQKTAIEYGPLVYAFEEADNAKQFDLLSFSGNDNFSINYRAELLGGINIISFSADEEEFTAIPYYAWSNRGVGKMKVWVSEQSVGKSPIDQNTGE